MNQNKHEKYYLSIPGLLVSTKSLSYEDIHAGINRYIDSIPALAVSFESNFDNIGQRRDRLDCFLANMDTVLELSRNVCARYLERDAETIIRSVQNDTSMSLARKMLKPFITDLLSLSIEMQKAQNSTYEGAYISEAETNTGIANNLSVVGGLIKDGDYTKAQNVAEEIKESIPGIDIVRLLDLITDKKHEEAAAMAVSMKEKYIEAVNQSAGADLSKTILAVDDRPETLAFVVDALKSRYKVLGATSGSMAVKMMDAHNPDLFILDIEMPDMDGFELAETIRGSDRHKKTPIIFLTGNSTRTHVDRAIKVGADDFIVKPTSHTTLAAKTGKFLFKQGRA